MAEILIGKIRGATSNDWELISEITTEEEVNEISFSTDMNGNAFELDEVYVYIEFMTENVICPSIQLLLNEQSTVYLYADSTTHAPTIITASRKDGKDMAKLEVYHGDTLKITQVKETENDLNVTKFRMQSFDSNFPIDTIVRMYGKKAKQ